ncbi:VOC family protein [Actinokineospora sp. HUAS TT18]|uniref:VOC family protein n=1 Tax=Actinokineospora sp. HUAS TT18 TaxID=3447451 RepID=UPI003F526B8D
MTIGLGGMTIDCANPRELAKFWTAALDYEIGGDHEGEFVFLAPKGAKPGEASYLGLQKVPEPRTGKNRAHLDFHTEDRHAEIDRLVGLGATVLAEHKIPGLTWSVLADPEGNEFCVGSSNG